MNELDYEKIVGLHHDSLYRFAFSLAHNPDDACELTQETFCRLLSKGGQLRDRSKVKTWLFTTMYRVFIGWKRRAVQLPHFEISSVADELHTLTPEMADVLDAGTVVATLQKIDERYRMPLVLFYLEELSYREIAEMLEVPCGTVMSRLSRGKEILRRLLSEEARGAGSVRLSPDSANPNEERRRE